MAGVKAVQDALNSLFVFGEVLETDLVQSLRGTPDEMWLNALELFAYGTYGQYKISKSNGETTYPDLPAPLLYKLKQLSFASFATKDNELSLAKLQTELDMETLRALEELIIESIYSELVKGKIDQERGIFIVSFAMSRDVAPSDVAVMAAKISTWVASSQQLVQTLSAGVVFANDELKKSQALETQLNEQRESVLAAIKVEQEQAAAAKGQGMGAKLMGQMGHMMHGRPGPAGGHGHGHGGARRT